MSKKFKKQVVTSSEEREGAYIISSSVNHENCAVCRLLKKCEAEKRDPADKEIMEALEEAKKDGAYVKSSDSDKDVIIMKKGSLK